MTQHTALPWRWLGMTGKPCLIQADGNWRTKLTRATLTLGDFVLPEDAEFACRAVNNHYPLLEALKELVDIAGCSHYKDQAPRCSYCKARAAIERAKEKKE